MSHPDPDTFYCRAVEQKRKIKGGGGCKKGRERTVDWEEREREKGKRWGLEREGRAWP